MHKVHYNYPKNNFYIPLIIDEFNVIGKYDEYDIVERKDKKQS